MVVELIFLILLFYLSIDLFIYSVMSEDRGMFLYPHGYHHHPMREKKSLKAQHNRLIW